MQLSPTFYKMKAKTQMFRDIFEKLSNYKLKITKIGPHQFSYFSSDQKTQKMRICYILVCKKI